MILPLFLLPTGITILLVVAGLILRRAALCWTGIVLLSLAGTPFVSGEAMRAAEGWQVRQPVSEAPTAHAIVVLSHGRVLPPGNADRFYGGIELFKAGKAPVLIFTGGWVPWQPNAESEGEVLMRYAADLGIPRDRMRTTAKVSNTEEESRAVAALIAKHMGTGASPRVLLVTSAFHMRRAQMLFARAGIEPVPFPVDFKVPARNAFTPLDLLPNAHSLSQSETALRELYGLAFYRLFRG